MENDNTRKNSLCSSVSEFSLKSLKFKIGYENLKDNLIPENKTTRRSVEISKSRTTIQVKVKKNEETIDKMLKKAMELKRSHKKLKNIFIKNRDKRNEIESEFSNSNINYESLIGNTTLLKKSLSITNLKRVNSEKKTISTSLYVNDLKFKHNNIKKTIISYENKIKNIKQNNVNLIKLYDQKFLDIEDAEKYGYNDQIDFLNNLIIEQTKKIEDLLVEKELIVRKLNDEKSSLQVIQDLNKLAFDKIDKQFNDESQILFRFKMSSDLMNNEAEWVESNLSKRKKVVKSLEIEIKNYEQKNQLLISQINDLSLKLTKIKPKRRYIKNTIKSPTTTGVKFKI